MDEQFPSNTNLGPRAGAGPILDPKQLAQLVIAARAARQGIEAAPLARSAAQQQSAAAQAPPASVVGPTHPFLAGAYGYGTAVPQGSVPPPDRVASKVGAIQSAREAQPPQASDADRAAGNFIRIGQRPLLPGYPADRWYHTYLEIPRFNDGKFTGKFDTYGVLGDWDDKNNEGTSDNQQVRENDRQHRNGPKKDSNRNQTYEVPVTADQLEALRKGAKYWSEWRQPGHQCPSCGRNYARGGPFSDPAYNSNTWVYNMLIHNPAGRIEAPAAINNKDAPGWAVNDVGRDYYPK